MRMFAKKVELIKVNIFLDDLCISCGYALYFVDKYFNFLLFGESFLFKQTVSICIFLLKYVFFCKNTVLRKIFLGFLRKFQKKCGKRDFLEKIIYKI